MHRAISVGVIRLHGRHGCFVRHCKLSLRYRLYAHGLNSGCFGLLKSTVRLRGER